ncbi:MAG: hypothetical protein V1721_03040 [Pseudomonadota bacterium]
MAGKKSSGKLKYLVVILAAAAAAAFLYVERSKTPPPDPGKHQTGYREEDRRNLERLIHQEGR